MSQEIELKHDIAPPAALGAGAESRLLRKQREAAPLSAPAKAEPVPIRREMTVAEGFATIVASCVRHYRLNEPLVIEARHAEALHQVRVAMRRLRSALSLFRPAIRDGGYAHIRDELRWFTAELGDARNLDVYLERELAADDRRLLEGRRDEAYDKAIAAMKSPRFKELMLELASWSAWGDWRQARRVQGRLGPFVNRRLDRLWSGVSAARRLRQMNGEDRHRLRIQVKKLRYAVDFVAALHSRKRKRQRKFGAALERLQDELGLSNDIVVARSLTGLESWLLDPGLLSLDEGSHVREARAALRQMRKIGSYWRA